MKKTLHILVFAFLLFLASCNDGLPWVEDCSDYDYSDCNTIEPDSTDLIIKVTIDNNHLSIPIVIYKGEIDNGTVLFSANVNRPEYYFRVPVDENYAVKATYKSGDRTIYAVDGDYVKKKSRRVCEATCWTVLNNEFDVRLKN